MTCACVLPSSSLRVAELRGESRRRKSKGDAQIAARRASLAQLLSSQKENPYKVKAYHRGGCKDPVALRESRRTGPAERESLNSGREVDANLPDTKRYLGSSPRSPPVISLRQLGRS